MVTVAIVAILAAIAYPSYRQSILKSNRTEAKAALMQATQNLEKYFTVNGTYAGFTIDPSAATTEHGYYTISLTSAPTATSYTVQAAAAGNQSDDIAACRTYKIDNIGNKTPAISTGCW